MTRPSDAGRSRIRCTFTLAPSTLGQLTMLAEAEGLRVDRGPSAGEPNRSAALEVAVAEALRRRQKKMPKNLRHGID